MSIELAIQDLTAAVRENTAAQKELLALAVGNAATNLVETPAAEPKKAAKKAAKKTDLKVVEPEPEPAAAEPEPTPEPEPVAAEPEPVAPVEDIETLRKTLFDTVKAKLADKPELRDTFKALRDKFGVERVPQLSEDQVQPFLDEVLTW